MELTDQLPCWAVVLSGIGLVAAGVAWRLIVDRRRKPLRRDFATEETGVHRSSYVLVMVGVVWTAYGVVQCL
jgi:hypothetical protein